MPQASKNFPPRVLAERCIGRKNLFKLDKAGLGVFAKDRQRARQKHFHAIKEENQFLHEMISLLLPDWEKNVFARIFNDIEQQHEIGHEQAVSAPDTPNPTELPLPTSEVGMELTDMVALLRTLGASEGDMRTAVLVRMGAKLTLDSYALCR